MLRLKNGSWFSGSPAAGGLVLQRGRLPYFFVHKSEHFNTSANTPSPQRPVARDSLKPATIDASSTQNHLANPVYLRG
jgi:hypothetical protein